MALFINIHFQCFSLFFILSVAVFRTIDSYAYLRVNSQFSRVISSDLGSHLILPCKVDMLPPPRTITWLKNGEVISNSTGEHPYISREGLLYFSPLITSDTGNYTCLANSLYDLKEQRTELYVKTPPYKLTNVTVHPTTIVATVRWHVVNDGGYPITNFTLLYRPTKANASESWHMPQPVHISPSIRQFFIYQLKPETDYTFKIWATNKLGPGEVVSIRASTCKPMEPPKIIGKMLADAENFSTTAWLVIFCMLAVTALTLLLISTLVIKEQRNASPKDETTPRIITNPGFEIDLEQCHLLDHADFNDNIEKPIRLNNNTVILPSRV